MSSKIKTALVGFGLSGRCFHAPFLEMNDNFELSYILERNKNESSKLYPKAKIIRSMEELLTHPVDLVVISTPNVTHVPYAKMALQRGKHVLLEKPFTATTEEADELIKVAEQADKILTVYQNRRFDGDFLTIKKLIADKTLGSIVELESHFDRYRKESPFRGWRREQLPGSGVLYDLGAHLIDQTLVLFGIPVSLWADLHFDHPSSSVDDGFTLYLKYPNKRVILRAGTLVKGIGPRFVLHGELGSYIKYGLDVQENALKKGEIPDTPNWGMEDPQDFGLLHLDNVEPPTQPLRTLAGNYMMFYESLAMAIKGKGEIPVKPQEAREVIRIIELAKKSFHEQRVISSYPI
ncbi:MAG: Gfo/Idh/MocA family oxidoreductase [Spirochaetaceae bacterium]|jgi:scyllo-inositol 2-dehydrogenase (NADP+)|nr:Gfo/Idh/MocA family oxidoreductase [Spirochaetaceae bacterium]